MSERTTPPAPNTPGHPVFNEPTTPRGVPGWGWTNPTQWPVVGPPAQPLRAGTLGTASGT
jgi:hypothetical protein